MTKIYKHLPMTFNLDPLKHLQRVTLVNWSSILLLLLINVFGA